MPSMPAVPRCTFPLRPSRPTSPRGGCGSFKPHSQSVRIPAISRTRWIRPISKASSRASESASSWRTFLSSRFTAIKILSRFQAYSQDHSTPNFLIELAHQVIDNGADAFVGHGVHNLRGVEIYKGKPIFYGVSSFFYHRGAAPEITSLSAGAGAGVNELEDNLETLLTTSRFEEGKLGEVRLYPADLGQDRTR